MPVSSCNALTPPHCVPLQVTVVWEINRLRRTLMLTVLAWASSLHDPATYARSYPAHLQPGTPPALGAAHTPRSEMVALPPRAF